MHISLDDYIVSLYHHSVDPAMSSDVRLVQREGTCAMSSDTGGIEKRCEAKMPSHVIHECQFIVSLDGADDFLPLSQEDFENWQAEEADKIRRRLTYHAAPEVSRSA